MTPKFLAGLITVSTQNGYKAICARRQLIRWSEEWQMLFNVNKCKVMHIGKQNQQRQYFMHDQCLEVVCQEKDLGILISNDLKVSQQCQQAYNKGFKYSWVNK